MAKNFELETGDTLSLTADNSAYELEIFGPLGAGTNFLVWWACEGMGYFHKIDIVSLDELTYDKTLDLRRKSPRILYCPESNEYQTNHPNVHCYHPFHFVFNIFKSLAKKQIHLDIDDEAKEFCQHLNYYKNFKPACVIGRTTGERNLTPSSSKIDHFNKIPQEVFDPPNKLIGFHINVDNLTNKQAIDLDYKLSSFVKNKLKHLDGFTINYRKFFFDHDEAHIKEVANFIGFDITNELIEVIKEYTNKNKQIILGDNANESSNL